MSWIVLLFGDCLIMILIIVLLIFENMFTWFLPVISDYSNHLRHFCWWSYLRPFQGLWWPVHSQASLLAGTGSAPRICQYIPSYSILNNVWIYNYIFLYIFIIIVMFGFWNIELTTIPLFCLECLIQEKQALSGD